MQTKHLCVLIHIWTKGEVGALWSRFLPSSKIFLLTVPRRCFFYRSFMLFLPGFCYAFVRLFIYALWSPAGWGLTSWLSCVISNWEVVTFPLVCLVRCGAWLYRFLIFAIFLTFEDLCTHNAKIHAELDSSYQNTSTMTYCATLCDNYSNR